MAIACGAASGSAPVDPTAVLWLSELNLSGDGQADLGVHGGPDKAVCAYPSEHLGPWTEELDRELGDAPFGENLSTVGVLERDVRIGDVWEWGSATLQVTQPRWPCFKLTLYRREAHIGERLRTTGRTGWYLRVLETGEVPAAGPIELVLEDPAGISVLDAHRRHARSRAGGSGPRAGGQCPSGAGRAVAGAAAAAARTLRSDVTSPCMSSTRRPRAFIGRSFDGGTARSTVVSC